MSSLWILFCTNCILVFLFFILLKKLLIFRKIIPSTDNFYNNCTYCKPMSEPDSKNSTKKAYNIQSYFLALCKEFVSINTFITLYIGLFSIYIHFFRKI